MASTAIALIIPAYNVENYIEDCLSSILRQNYSDWRCIVVDDGSTDSTRERALAWSDARVDVVSQPNKGVSAARNTGLAQAAGDFVMFLDGDDVLHPSALMPLSDHSVRYFRTVHPTLARSRSLVSSFPRVTCWIPCCGATSSPTAATS